MHLGKTLCVTPAMAANVTKRLWEMSDVVDVLDTWEAKAANSGGPFILSVKGDI